MRQRAIVATLVVTACGESARVTGTVAKTPQHTTSVAGQWSLSRMSTPHFQSPEAHGFSTREHDWSVSVLWSSVLRAHKFRKDAHRLTSQKDA